jgi:uncharacterized protein (TIGR02118 family)
MIRVSVFYPAGDGTTFDHDYYRNTHVPMCTKAWNVKAEIDKGTSGPYAAAVHFFFDSPEKVQAAMAGPEIGAIMADLPNYTNTQPVIQTSEVV